MVYLLIVSLLWAFSFGLIKEQLSSLNANFVAFVRMLLAFLVFLPFLRFKEIEHKKELFLLGIIQFGFMYIVYIFSYQFLQAYQVALFTIFTPIYVTLIDDVLKRKFHTFHFWTALLSVIGTGIIIWKQADSILIWKGFGLVQLSNLCFAFGQVYYRKLRGCGRSIIDDARVFALIYLGAVFVTGIFAGVTTEWSGLVLSSGQIRTLVYLGILASGFGFFLWNYGSTKVNAGTLAVFNNLKIPLAILVALLFFGEQTNIPRLLVGGSLVLGSLWLNEQYAHQD